MRRTIGARDETRIVHIFCGHMSLSLPDHSLGAENEQTEVMPIDRLAHKTVQDYLVIILEAVARRRLV